MEGDTTTEDTPEITITSEEEPSESTTDDITEDEGETKEDEPKQDDEKDSEEAPDKPEGEKDTKDTLKVPSSETTHMYSLKEMDRRYSWLDKMEEKYMNLETTFISKIQFVAISNHCQKYLDDILGKENMTQYCIEFSNLFDKFQIVFAGSQRLLNKLSEATTYKKLANDQNRKLETKLDAKQREVEEGKECLDSVYNEVEEKKKEINRLQNVLNELSSTRNKTSIPDEQELQRTKRVTQSDDELEAKIRQQEEELEMLNNELELINQRELKYLGKIKQQESAESSLKNELNSVKFDLQKQITRADKAEAAAVQNATEVKNKDVFIKSLTEESKQLKTNLETAKSESKRLFNDLRKVQKEHDATTQLVEKIRRDVSIREEKLKMLISQNESISLELTNKQTEVYELKGEISTITKERNALTRRATLLDEKCADAETKFESVKKLNSTQQKELDLIRKELEESENKNKELIKQKDTLTEEALKYEQIITELRSDVKILEENNNNITKDLEKVNRKVNNLKDDIKRSEKVKAQMEKKSMELNKNIIQLKGETKRLELQISNLKKLEEKLRTQLHEEETRYKHLADDERHFRRLCAESRHEIEQLNEQQTMMSKFNDQLQSSNEDLDEQNKKLELKVNHITEQLGNAKELHNQQVNANEELKVQLKRKDDQEQQLLKNIADKDNFILTLKRKAKNLIEEKNVQNSKLNDREKEICELKENLRLLQQESTLLDKTLNDRIDDIKLLKVQISQMNKTNALMTEQVDNMDITRHQLTEVHSKLLEEKHKAKALEKEAQRPINLHRWRILEGIDPNRAQLVTKNQALQKQLKKKMAELDSKEVELIEKDTHTKKLEGQLKRRAESDIQEQLWVCKKELSSRIERIKCLTAENSMFESLCGKYEQEIMTLKTQLSKYKVAELNSKTAFIKAKY